MATATRPLSLRRCSAAAAVPRSAWARSAVSLGRNNRNNGIGLKLPVSPLLAGPTPTTETQILGQGRKELDAIWHALVTGPLESIVLTLREIVAAGNLFRCRSFHVGTLSGALLVVAGLCQLCKTTPTLFMDIVLGYVFYKLSALSGQLQREGKSFSICARLQLVLLLVLSFKDNSAFQGFYRALPELIRSLNIYMYFTMVYDRAVGVKHGRVYWLGICRLLRTKGGLMKVVRNTILDMYGGNEPVSSAKEGIKSGSREIQIECSFVC